MPAIPPRAPWQPPAALLAFAFALASSPSLLGQAEPGLANSGLADPVWAGPVSAAIEAQIAADRIPGLSCAVGLAGAVPYARGFGLANVENAVAASPTTVYRLASISKPITAVLALQCVEQGRLDLDRDVSELVPTWPKKAWPVTTRQLLAHLGGVRHYRPGEAESTVHYANQTEGLVRFAADPLLHQPGSAYHYSTYGYALAGAVVEQATGRTLPQVLAERVAGPAQAPTLQDDDPRRIVRGRAAGYVFQGDELRNSALMDGSYKLGGGGLCCSAPDLVRFGQALLDGRLLQPATLALAWTPVLPGNGKPSDYGLGFRILQRSGRRVVMHSGAQSQVSTTFYMLPEQGLVVALLCNLEKVRLQPLAEKISDLVLMEAKR